MLQYSIQWNPAIIKQNMGNSFHVTFTTNSFPKINDRKQAHQVWLIPSGFQNLQQMSLVGWMECAHGRPWHWSPWHHLLLMPSEKNTGQILIFLKYISISGFHICCTYTGLPVFSLIPLWWVTWLTWYDIRRWVSGSVSTHSVFGWV